MDEHAAQSAAKASNRLARKLAKDEDVVRWMERYGPCMPIEHARFLTKISKAALTDLSQILGFGFHHSLIRPEAYKHLPAIPSDTIVHQWEGGTKYITPVHDQPGYVSITVHEPLTTEDDSAHMDEWRPSPTFWNR